MQPSAKAATKSQNDGWLKTVNGYLEEVPVALYIALP